VAQTGKKLDPHSADSIGNAGDSVGDRADPSVDVDKEKVSEPSDSTESSDDYKKSVAQKHPIKL